MAFGEFPRNLIFIFSMKPINILCEAPRLCFAQLRPSQLIIIFIIGLCFLSALSLHLSYNCYTGYWAFHQQYI